MSKTYPPGYNLVAKTKLGLVYIGKPDFGSYTTDDYWKALNFPTSEAAINTSIWLQKEFNAKGIPYNFLIKKAKK